MSRLRTIKPEFFTSEQVVECSPSARLLFVGMWCFCDDRGVHPASISRLKMEIFPADQIKNSEIEKWVGELLKTGLLIQFSSEGKEWWAVTGWHHQRIDKPTCKYPPPPIRGALVEPSDSPPVVVDESSLRSGAERSGLEEQKPPLPPAGGESWPPAEKNRKRKPKASVEATAFPPGFDSEEIRKAVGDWIEHRKQKGDQATQLSIERMLARCVKHRRTPAEFADAVDESISNCWTGVHFPNEHQSARAPPRENPHPIASNAERSKREIDKIFEGR